MSLCPETSTVNAVQEFHLRREECGLGRKHCLGLIEVNEKQGRGPKILVILGKQREITETTENVEEKKVGKFVEL